MISHHQALKILVRPLSSPSIYEKYFSIHKVYKTHAERRQRTWNTAYENIMSERSQSIMKSTYEKVKVFFSQRDEEEMSGIFYCDGTSHQNVIKITF